MRETLLNRARSLLDNKYDQSYIMSIKELLMKTIGAARFKERCLALLDNLEPEGLVITKHGTPVATLKPYARSSASLIGALAGKIEIRDDALATGENWDAVAEP
jgi:antitoxin (DNA-binding transcriptional repressor) of toxin-antitoxin stability system